ncbi:MAG: YciI family protein [Rhizobiaceae bacterium]
MLYAILAYHVEEKISSMSAAEDTALMADLERIHERLTKMGSLGPAARLGKTKDAVTLRDAVMDGPFAETKEQLLGFYIVDFETQDEAVAAARDLRSVNPTAVYEVRPIVHFRPGATLDG